MFQSLHFCWHTSAYCCTSVSLAFPRARNLKRGIRTDSTPVRAFSRRSRIAFDLPELVDNQRASFHRFIKDGIPDVFSQIAPINVQVDDIQIELLLNGANYKLKAPEETVRECILKMKTYSCPLYVEVKLLYKTVSGELLDSKKGEWVLIGHLPIMTKRGHFIINGSPRVIVHQLVRSPGIYFRQVLEKEERRRVRFYGDIIPRRGVWLRLQITQKGKIEAKLKKSKKVSADLLQRCFESLEGFERRRSYAKANAPTANLCRPDVCTADLLTPLASSLRSEKFDLAASKGNPLGSGRLPATPLRDLVLPALESITTPPLLSTVDQERSKASGENAQLVSLMSAPEQKALLYTYDKLYRPAEEKEREELSRKERNRSLSNSVSVDRRLKVERSYKNLFSTFKDKSRYNLGDLGRERMNTKLGVCVLEKQLTALDIYAASDSLYKLTKGERSVDDIDHFQNRRVRTSGELLHTQFENGIDRLKKRIVNKLQQLVQLQSQHRTAGSTSSQGDNSTQQTDQSQNRFTFLRPSKQDLGSTQSISTPDVSVQRERAVHPVHRVGDAQKGRKETRILPLQASLPLTEKGAESRSRVQLRDPDSFDLMARQVGERPALLSQRELGLTSIKELLSTKPLNGALRELFGSNPLSQYMDQTNPLADVTHKRRMSCLGIGGVSRDSAGMAIRGIHPTHYGRICPIETPEGKNAGLVNSLAMYAKINDQGFVETPYYQVVKGQVQQELGFRFFSAKQESSSHLNIAASDLQQSWNNMLATDSVPVRVADNLLDLFKKIDSYQVDCITVSPVQMISVATSLIPFLEHNDANRALMGSNMQRQAVPLMIPERAIVGTGLESLVVAESGHLLQSHATGFVSYVSADTIVVDSLCCTLAKERAAQVRLSKLHKKKLFSKRRVTSLKREGALPQARSLSTGLSQIGGSRVALSTKCLSFIDASSARADLLKHRQFSSSRICYPTGKVTDRAHLLRSRTLCQGPASSDQHSGVNVEHIFQVKREEKRRDLPIFWRRAFQSFNEKLESLNQHQSRGSGRRVTQLAGACLPANKICFQNSWLKSSSRSMTRTFINSLHPVDNFDRSNQDTCLTQRALVREGDWVQKGDILTDCSASDNGELAVGKNILVAYIPWEGYNFEDAIVISERLVKEDVYTSLHVERYDFTSQNVKGGSEWFTNDLPGIPHSNVKHLDELGLPKVGTFVKEGDILVGKMRYSNKKPTTPYERLLFDLFGENNFSARDSSLYVPKGVHARVIQRKIIKHVENRSGAVSNTAQLPKVVHIFLGEKRAIQVGDKMSGRHGNKGVVAKILPRQDMPYLADGTPIDIILNPLGVPSRMNVGQVFEALLGLAGTYLAQHFKIMCFDELYGVEASQSLVYLKLYQARLQSGQNWLFQVDFPGKMRVVDGRSGECFDQWVTVGRAYILKLIHMVNEKIHARATGPYALITQQPLRGRSQKGGQRLGEMEVWALEGFGAAYTLQELLTRKSDDLVGRKEVPSAILPRPISVLDAIQPLHRKEENRLLLGQPEIFKVLLCELQALCLDVGVYSLTTQSFQRTFLSGVN